MENKCLPQEGPHSYCVLDSHPLKPQNVLPWIRVETQLLQYFGKSTLPVSAVLSATLARTFSAFFELPSLVDLDSVGMSEHRLCIMFRNLNLSLENC